MSSYVVFVCWGGSARVRAVEEGSERREGEGGTGILGERIKIQSHRMI
jgi:hypothetical protein